MDYLWDDLREVVAENQEAMERIRGIVVALRTFSRLDEAAWKDVDVNEGLRSTL